VSELGFQGFVCPRGAGNVDVMFCINSCRNRCLSIPMLVALADNKREIEPKKYHVTEILDPAQIVWLSRTQPYWCSPLSMVWMLFGSAIHTIMEQGHNKAVELGVADRFICEHRFETEVGGCILTGRYDLYDTIDKTLWDFKSIKAYAVEKLLCGDFTDSKYGDQFNIYRTYGCPDAEHIKMEAIVKDWSMLAKMNPVEDIEFPLVDHDLVKEFARSRIELHEYSYKYEDAPPCEDRDLWIPKSPRSKNFGIPIRCRDYCKVSGICPQWKKWKEKNAE